MARTTIISLALFLGIGLNSNAVFAQQEGLDFYPLHIGNQWQLGPTIATSFSNNPWRVVIGDTLKSNQKRYQSIQDEAEHNYTVHFERVDSTEMIVYRYELGAVVNSQVTNEYPFLLLPNGPESRSWSGDSPLFDHISCDWKSNRELFGQVRRIWSCNTTDDSSNWIWDLAEGLGVALRNPNQNLPYLLQLGFASINGSNWGFAVSVEEEPTIPIQLQVSAFPNPTHAGESVTIEVPGLVGSVRIKLVDLLGRMVGSKMVELSNDSSVRFDIPTGLTEGIYLLQMSDQNGVRSSSGVIIVQK